MTWTVMTDAEAAVRAWINANPVLTGGATPPIKQGAHLKRLDSVRGTYAYLILINTTDGVTAESPISLARVSATIYGATKGLAETGARAYANQLHDLRLTARRVSMGPYTCVTVDEITGPSALDDHETTREQYRYLVDATFHLIN